MVNDRHSDVDRWLIDSATEELSRDSRDPGALYERPDAYMNTDKELVWTKPTEGTVSRIDPAGYFFADHENGCPPDR